VQSSFEDTSSARLCDENGRFGISILGCHFSQGCRLHNVRFSLNSPWNDCFGKSSKIIIPATLREIGTEAFSARGWLNELLFEEGVLRTSAGAFQYCNGLRTLTFPASLEVIGERPFYDCRSLRDIKFSAGSQLQCIQKEAFADCPLETVILPAAVKEIDRSAFEPETWPLVKFDGPPPLLILVTSSVLQIRTFCSGVFQKLTTL
jgi:hypothetical protein